MTTFELNEKKYPVKKFDFNAICYLESQGVNLANPNVSQFLFIRAFISYCMNVTPEEAGDEISAHVDKYGWDSLNAVFDNAVEELTNEGFSEGQKKARKTTPKVVK